MQLDKGLESILSRVAKPARYIGGETNIVRKDPADVNVRLGFAFPDTYEIGMSYLGLQILYDILNREDDVYCERIFAPAPDMEEIMRQEDRRLITLETFTPADQLDIIGFTLQYEMSFTNVLNMLDLAGIPIRKTDRCSRLESPGNPKVSDKSKVSCDPNGSGRAWPLIIAGGPCAFNPEPLSDFIDVFLIGDGEELLPRICSEYSKIKSQLIATSEWNSKDGPSIKNPVKGLPPDLRKTFLKRIASIDGVYVPEFYEPEYKEDGTLKGMKVIDEAAPEKVSRAIVSDIEGVAFPTKNLVPLIDTVHDRSVVETFRGCTRGCRFCQAGMIYRPVRERRADEVVSLAMDQLSSTGHDELSLLSLSTSDHSAFESMATDLMSRCKRRNVALSLPSLRLDSFSFKVLQEIQGYRKSGLTFAPEAGTQRLRDVINKNITEEDIYSATRQAIELGWETIKLYFMIGLPTETDEDLDGIAEIARKIIDINYEIRGRKGGRFRVTVSVSNFVPKAHTPFQWVAQDTPEEFIRKHDYLSQKLRIKGVTFNYHESNTSSIEAVFARGDRRCGRLLEEAWKSGCKFDAWSEHFDEDKWAKAFERSGIDPAFYTSRERSVSEVLPWDHIDSFVRREYLAQEYEKATSAIVTPDCRQGCTGCGINRVTECFVNAGVDGEKQERREERRDQEAAEAGQNYDRLESSVRKYVIEFTKTGTICYTSHLDLMRMFKRAFKRAGIPLAYSQGFNPHPKMGFAQPLSLGYWGMSEYIEFEVMAEYGSMTADMNDGIMTADIDRDIPSKLMAEISSGLPEGIDLIRCIPADDLRKTLASHTVAAEYMIEIPVRNISLIEREDVNPVNGIAEDIDKHLFKKYMDRGEILAWKRQKKSKDLKQIDIKPMIRDISFAYTGGILYIKTILDSGSASNLSPELIISSVTECFGLDTDRSDVSVMRKRIIFDKETEEQINQS